MYVVGTPFDDVLAALADLDRVLGLAGNDTLTSAVNGSRLSGMEGDDTLTTALDVDSAGSNPVVLGAWQSGGTGRDKLTVTLAAKAIYNSGLTEAASMLHGGNGDDTITATAQATGNGTANATNKVNGGAGNDVIDVTASGDAMGVTVQNQVNAADGDDKVVARAAILYGFGDSLAENVISTGDGDDFIEGYALSSFWGDNEDTRNFVRSGSGNDVIFLVASSDSQLGGSAINDVDAGSGDDEVRVDCGTSSNEGIPFGSNIVFGRAGDDLIIATKVPARTT